MKLKLTSFEDIESIIEESFAASSNGIGGFDVDELSCQLIDRADKFFCGDDNEQ